MEDLTAKEIHRVLFDLSKERLEGLPHEDQLDLMGDVIELANVLRESLNKEIKGKKVPASLIAMAIIALARGFVADYLSASMPDLGG